MANQGIFKTGMYCRRMYDFCVQRIHKVHCECSNSSIYSELWTEEVGESVYIVLTALQHCNLFIDAQIQSYLRGDSK